MKANRAGDGQHAGEKLGKAHQKTVGKLINVGHHSADQLTHRVLVEVTEGENLNFAEGVARISCTTP